MDRQWPKWIGRRKVGPPRVASETLRSGKVDGQAGGLPGDFPRPVGKLSVHLTHKLAPQAGICRGEQSHRVHR
jgi:hypothetical protein